MSLIVVTFDLIMSMDVFFGFFAFAGVGVVAELGVSRLCRHQCLSMMDIPTPST